MPPNPAAPTPANAAAAAPAPTPKPSRPKVVAGAHPSKSRVERIMELRSTGTKDAARNAELLDLIVDELFGPTARPGRP